MTALRNLFIGAATLSLSVMALASAAGASGHIHTGFAFTAGQQAKFIKAVHAWVPATKHEKSSNLITTGKAICNALPAEDVHLIETEGPKGKYTIIGTVADVYGVFTDDNIKLGDRAWSTVNANDLFGMAVLELCPGWESGVREFNQTEGAGTTTVPTSSAPPPKPKYIGNSAAAYKNGYTDGTSGGAFFQPAPLSEDCQKSYQESKPVPIFGPTGAIVGSIPDSPTVRSNYVAGCIAGVESNNNNGLGYNETDTTTTTTSTPAPSPDGYTDAQVCADFSQGQSGNQVVSDVVDAGDLVPWGPAYQFVVGAVSSTCPQYTDAVDAIQHG